MAAYEAAVLDVDGTIVRGDALLPGALEGIRALDERGISRLLFSNNPTRGPTYYRGKLEPHGVRAEPERILTSASVSAAYLADAHPDDRLFLVGEPRLRSILEDAGLAFTADPADAEVVLASIDREFSYATLRDALDAFENDPAFYGTDPDVTIPVDEGAIPGSGAIIAAVEAVAGREPDAILGKPSDVAIEAAFSRLGADPASTLVVGDRLDTDVALGARAGAETALVLTGATDRADLDDASIEPDHVLDSLGGIVDLL